MTITVVMINNMKSAPLYLLYHYLFVLTVTGYQNISLLAILPVVATGYFYVGTRYTITTAAPRVRT